MQAAFSSKGYNDVRAGFASQPEMIVAVGKVPDEIGGLPRSLFFAGVGILCIACAILTPLSIFGIRKWMAHDELLKQYQSLKNQGASNDFDGAEISEMAPAGYNPNNKYDSEP